MLNIDKNTVSKWFNIFRNSAEKHLELNFQQVGGDEHIVQIDETVIARRKYQRGRLVSQQWLFGAIDTINRHFILKCVDDRSRSTLRSVILETICTGSIVHSDRWSSYMSIFDSSFPFHHDSVNHTQNFVDPNTGVHTNLIENLWMLLKQSLRRRFLRSRMHLDLYLAEFCLRSKYKNSKSELFLAILKYLKFI